MITFRESAIANALFTKTQQRVLGILYGDIDKSFYLNQIARLAKVGKGSVTRELKKLCDVDLLVELRQGNQHHYQANRASPIYAELSGIIYKTIGMETLIRLALEPLIDVLEQAFIYGSFADGDENKDAIINLILVSDRLTPGGASPIINPLQRAIGRSFNTKIISRSEYVERITKKQSFISLAMAQPKIWLMNKRS